MVSLKNKNKGFTIVELLIVIIIIGILATLVIVTFTGINQKARNSKRQTDVNAITSHVQAFYAQYGFYPTQADLVSTSFRSSYMKGLDAKALQDPKQNGTGTIGTSVGAAQYGYVASSTVTGNTCNNTTATDDTGGAPQDNTCDTFQVQAQMEGQPAGSNLFTKSSN
jgi:prepilin-type N-terminal cleavage/methylation domain-containing protein